MTIEAPQYREAQADLADDPIMVVMEWELRHHIQTDLLHEDGTPRFRFMVAARDEYRRRGGARNAYGMGDYARALMLVRERRLESD